MLGASCRGFHPEALTLVRGERIKIVGQNDNAGRNAAQSWHLTLTGKGISVEQP
jgi:hypothetical protein